MARPKKQTVDYFPHYCNGSKTLNIVEAQYGNEGYAFWFKMLEIVGKTEGHVFDYSDEGSWLYLLTYTLVSEDKAKKILETFAKLGMIDKELWERKIFWVQHFVDEHVALYARRKVELPLRPGSSWPVEPLSAFQIAQVSGDKRTIKELSEGVKIEDDLKVAVMIKYFEQEAKRMLTPNDLKQLVDFADHYPDGWFEKAVDEAVKNTARSPIRYIEKIMETWKTEGVNPFDERKRQGRASKAGATDTSTEQLKQGITGAIE